MQKLRSDALLIFQAALDAANPSGICRKWAKRSFTAPVGKVWVIGAGKASAAMAQGLEAVIGPKIAGGLINVKYGHTAPLKYIQLNECGHPVPDESGISGARRIAEIAKSAKAEDLVICLISGGASSLLPYPVNGLTLQHKQEITRGLLACGADIHEMNTVRKHLSQIKGGQLAALAYPARVVSLILSDVVGDNLDVIGSGPTAPDSSTVADAQAVLAKYGMESKLLQETPKTCAAENIIIGSNRQALAAAAKKSGRLGYGTLLLSSSIEGETRDVARMHAAIAREIHATGNPLKPPACIISGGETTVTIRGSGKGGRNQEFALAAAMDISGLPDTLILSAGTDGTDGPTDAAGGIVDGTTADDSAPVALAANDSYPYLAARDALIITGPTNTNVMDIHLVMVSYQGSDLPR